ncbi:MAG: CotH kinase family protein [Clostridia bacterium]|nr:CotH kinase family protein [Clostridia bacterium]
MKRFLSVFLCLVMAAAMLPLGLFRSYAEESFGIDKTSLRAGEKLTVSNPDGYVLKYYIDETEIGSGELILDSSYNEKWITVRGYSGNEVAAEDKIYFSSLPVLYITTGDGRGIESKIYYKPGTLSVQGNEENFSAGYDGAIQIRGRGSSSWAWPKKSMKIKLDKKADLFGMGKSKHWVLISNYLDESALRNATGQQLAKAIGIDCMDCTWTDVILNGEYIGNYLLIENVRIGKTRVDIFDWEDEASNVASAINKAEKAKGNKIDKDGLESALATDLSWVTTGTVTFDETEYNIRDYYDYCDDISGGYLFELSEEYDEVSKFKTDYNLKVMVKSPEYLITNAEMTDYVKQLFQDFEDAYLSEDGYVNTANGRKHYTELADLDSMVKYWLVNEIMGNNDASIKSRYVYVDRGGKLIFGPVWDFDWGAGTFKVTDYALGWKISKFNLDNTNYADKKGIFIFQQFLDDPLFIARATELYWEIRPFVDTLIQDGGYIDRKKEYLYDSLFADHTVWDRSVYWPGENRTRGFEKDTEVFKQYMNKRIAWLDSQFASDVSLINSTRTQYSAYPYYYDDAMLRVRVLNGVNDSVSAHAAADSVLRSGISPLVEISVHDNVTRSLNIYVNGLFHCSASLAEDAVSVTVPETLLTAEEGSKNVISVIGKDESGETTYRNFTTVICGDEYMTVPCTSIDREHSFTHYTENGDGTWVSYCDCCGTAEIINDPSAATGHNYGDWTTLSSSCTESGTEQRVCSFCGNVDTRVTPPTGHEYVVTVVRPTCTEPGYTEHTCQRCHDSFTDSHTEPLGHHYSVETNKAPTDTEDGYLAYACSRCGELRIDTILPAGSIIPGDADGDKEISDWDQILFERYLVGWSVDIDLDALDLDKDGFLSDWDAIMLARYLAGWKIQIG